MLLNLPREIGSAFQRTVSPWFEAGNRAQWSPIIKQATVLMPNIKEADEVFISGMKPRGRGTGSRKTAVVRGRGPHKPRKPLAELVREHRPEGGPVQVMGWPLWCLCQNGASQRDFCPKGSRHRLSRWMTLVGF